MYLKRIRDLREDNDLSQKEIANYLHVSQSTYSDYETGKINIPLEMVIELSEYYKTSIDYLIGKINKK